jgi:hypothetical protein
MDERRTGFSVPTSASGPTTRSPFNDWKRLLTFQKVWALYKEEFEDDFTPLLDFSASSSAFGWRSVDGRSKKIQPPTIVPLTTSKHWDQDYSGQSSPQGRFSNLTLLARPLQPPGSEARVPLRGGAGCVLLALTTTANWDLFR